MKNIIIISIILSLISLTSIAQKLTTERIFDEVDNSVVVVLAYNSNNKIISQGSGVVISNEGSIVTNYHVIKGSSYIQIKHYNIKVNQVDLEKYNARKDIAILKIPANTFTAIKTADVTKLKTGQQIYAIGSPMGLENSMTEGIISGLRYTDETGRELIQISASISPGSSGGAVVNSQGELIGISTSSIKGGQNLNFAISIDEILNVNNVEKEKTKDKDELLVESILSQANEQYEKGNYKEAVKLYTEFMKKAQSLFFNQFLYNKERTFDYDEKSIYLYRGKAYLKLKEYGKASADFMNSYKNEEVYIYKGICSSYEGLELIQNKKTSFAVAYLKFSIDDYSSAIALNSSNATTYRNRGISHYNLAQCWIKLGDNYKATSECSKATEDFNMAIRLDVNNSSDLSPLIQQCK